MPGPRQHRRRTEAAEAARVPDDDIAKLDSAGSPAELVASAKEYRDAGDSAHRVDA